MQIEQPVGYGFKSKVLCGIKVKFNKHTKPGKKNVKYTVHLSRLQQNEIQVYVLFD